MSRARGDVVGEGRTARELELRAAGREVSLVPRRPPFAASGSLIAPDGGELRIGSFEAQENPANKRCGTEWRPSQSSSPRSSSLLSPQLRLEPTRVAIYSSHSTKTPSSLHPSPSFPHSPLHEKTCTTAQSSSSSPPPRFNNPTNPGINCISNVLPSPHAHSPARRGS